MANSNLQLSFSFFFTSLFLLQTISSSNDVISDICQKTTNPSFCGEILRSANTTDLKKLAGFSLNLAGENADKTLRLVQSLAEKATDPKLKERYSSCSENYDEAVGNINVAKQNLGAGDFNGVNVVTSGVMEEVYDCSDSFKQPPSDPSSLPQNAKTLEDVCSLVLVISNLLPLPF